MENVALKHKKVELKAQVHDMKLVVNALTKGSKEQLEDIRTMFLSKKQKLIDVINNLKVKMNDLNDQFQNEMRVQDALLLKEKDLTRRLKAEILRAKDVLMSHEMSWKAHSVFKQFVHFDSDEKVFLEDGSLHELLDQ